MLNVLNFAGKGIVKRNTEKNRKLGTTVNDFFSFSIKSDFLLLSSNSENVLKGKIANVSSRMNKYC